MRRDRSILGTLLTLTVASMAWGPSLADAAALQKIRMTQPVATVSFLPIYVGLANKYFEAEGIDLEVIITQGDGPDVQALLAKNVDFTTSSPHHLYLSYLEGKPLLGVFNALNRCVINFVIHKEVAKERGITESTPLAEKLKALKGLTVGATRPGALTYNLAIYFAKKAGYDPQRDLKIIGAGAGPALVAALEHRKVDLFATSAPTPEQAIARGFGMFFINNAAGEDPDLGEFLQEVLYVRPDYARENPETVRKMVRALFRSNAWILQQPPAEIAKAVQPFFEKINPQVLVASVQSVKQAVPPDGRLTERGSDAFQEVMLAAGVIRRKVAFSAVLTNDYLPTGGGR